MWACLHPKHSDPSSSSITAVQPRRSFLLYWPRLSSSALLVLLMNSVGNRQQKPLCLHTCGVSVWIMMSRLIFTFDEWPTEDFMYLSHCGVGVFSLNAPTITVINFWSLGGRTTSKPADRHKVMIHCLYINNFQLNHSADSQQQHQTSRLLFMFSWSMTFSSVETSPG